MRFYFSIVQLAFALANVHFVAAQATVAVLNQNAVWAGIENRLEVTCIHAFDEIHVHGARRTHFQMQGMQHAAFSILPDAGAETVSISMRNGTGSPQAAAVFRVVPLPPPNVQFGTFVSGQRVSDEALEMAEMRAAIPGIGEEVPLVWIGFQLSILQDKKLDHYQSDGQDLTSGMRKALSRAKKGANIFFTGITIETPDGARHLAEDLLLFKQ